MQALTAPLRELADFDKIMRLAHKKKGMLRINGCVTSQKTHMMYALSDGCFYKVIACSSAEKARDVYEEYKFLSPNTYLYPARDLLFYQADVKSRDLTSERMRVLKALFMTEDAAGGDDGGEGHGITVVTTFDGFMDSLLPKEEIRKKILRIGCEDTLDLAALSGQLVGMGYEREDQVGEPGQFAIRGGILDVFPLTEDVPVRIELWGDQVDSIRTFDADSQRSLENLAEAVLYPATEFAEEGSVSFLDYFPSQDTLLFLDEPDLLLEAAQGIEDEFLDASEKREESGYESDEPQVRLYTVKEVAGLMNDYSSVGFFALEMRVRYFALREYFTLDARGVNPYNNSFELLTQDLAKLKRNKYRVILLSGSRTRAKRLAEDLRDYSLHSFYSEDLDREVMPGEIMTAYGHVTEGYEYPMIRFMVIAETDIFGKVKKKRRRHIYEGRRIRDFTDLKVGDYVVHESHGLGIYQGIEKIEVDKVAKDYMKISYAKGANLYIPVTQLDLIQKYAGSDAKKPRLNQLGGQEWKKTKSRVKGAVQEVAKDLVDLYAARQSQKGYEFSPDTPWQKEFEEMFPYEETEDQTRAIEDVKKDMESPKIMDRLICGDVGYGKTEVALRAAFKAVMDGKQVVYLVPTTVLAQQHYNTFVQRMKDFPVRVDLLCRFRTSAEQNKTVEDARKGLVDIVIGTHRVLSNDVEFKDLGLLIIDEEQRFGVRHKEKIKKLRQNVDVLTLTATPIPRTLHMSLIGIRDMSVLEEPPQDRMPIQTYVMEFDEELVREAIERELARQGQVYYVYNRVEDIVEMTDRIKNLVPQATVAYAHGQMKEHELERIMVEFIDGEIDVLVSTTIIETGIDIPNVNTMIVHDADRMGLSQLYQLRGRVGRSNRMAYAFLLYRRDKMLKEEAVKRLSAIREFSDLGSGFKIAMRDLEIRGAGNLLGAAQHGHMEAVGYDLYCKMLNEAVKEQRGELDEEDTFATTMDLNVDAYIPDEYIPNEAQKLDVYKRIAAIETEEDLEDMQDELTDRFGEIPKKVEMLLDVARLKSFAHSADVLAVEQKGEVYTFTMYERARVNPAGIPTMLDIYKGDLTFQANGSNPVFRYEKKNNRKNGLGKNPLDIVKKVLTDIKGLIEI